MKLKQRKNNIYRFFKSNSVIILFLLFFSIGYALVQTSLEVSGKINISDDINKFFMQRAIRAINNSEIPIGVNSNNPNYDIIASLDEGVYALEDDYGISYYYRGNITNNYVKYGVNAEGKDMYWRIIRINGDSTVRMIYDGTSLYANEESIEDRVAISSTMWNSYYNDNKYVGYMFGGANGIASTSKTNAQRNDTSTDIKDTLDTWYLKNIINTGYSNNISDTLFCSDRSTASQVNLWWDSDTTLGYAENYTAYGAYSRNKNSSGSWKESGVNAIFKCPNKNDAFTVDDINAGNGALIYPVGLITVDEAIAAGSRGGVQNLNYYLHKGVAYYTMSPNYYNPINGSRVFAVSKTGNIYNVDYTSNLAIVPVINLKADFAIKMIGTGTIDDPYREV